MVVKFGLPGDLSHSQKKLRQVYLSILCGLRGGTRDRIRYLRGMQSTTDTQLAALQRRFSQFLTDRQFRKVPLRLYEPVDYILSLGGKRLRPVVVLMAYRLFRMDVTPALPAALAIEVFHNFTLLHDDVMDKSKTRRGKPTVHEAWDTNQAILSGDVMLIEAYRLLAEATPAELLPKVLRVFSSLAVEVCEGQQFDMNFETRDDVTIEQYLRMIELKTAVLFGGALQIGALLGGATDADAEHLYRFGRDAGIAFQLRDDLLDTFGDAATFGKRIGGDILNNKQTYLVLKTMELLGDTERGELRALMLRRDLDEQVKIDAVKAIFDTVDIQQLTEALSDQYHSQAVQHLKAVRVDEEQKAELYELAERMRRRAI